MGGGDNDVAAVAKVISTNKSHSQDGTPLRTNATPQVVNKYVTFHRLTGKLLYNKHNNKRH